MAKTEEELLKYVRDGGVLAITGVLPTRYETGEKCTFFGGIQVGENVIGKGRVYFEDKYLGQGASEKDALEDIAAFGELLNKANIVPRVRISCDKLVLNGFNGTTEQVRMLGSAVLQEANGETILFVLNHYPEAHEFTLQFSIPANKLVCLTEGRDAVVENGICQLDIDRKCCEIYRVE